jgi:hypothetical protein
MSEVFVEGWYEEVSPILPLVDSSSFGSYGDGFTNEGGYRSQWYLRTRLFGNCSGIFSPT